MFFVRAPLNLKVTARRISISVVSSNRRSTLLRFSSLKQTMSLSSDTKNMNEHVHSKVSDKAAVQPQDASHHDHHESPKAIPDKDEHAQSHSDHSHTTHSHTEHSHSHSIFAPHTHSHQPNELLSTSVSSIKSNPAVRITWIGLLVNVAMAITKGAGGVYFHSQSLVADAIHSVSDMVADFLTLATVNVSSRIGNPQNFPLGYGKIETVGSILVSGVLLFAGISVGWSSLLQVFEYWLPQYVYEYAAMIQIGHSHGPVHEHSNTSTHQHSHLSDASEPHTETSHVSVPNINAAWIAGASILVKELLFRKTMKVAVETNSKVLVANAWHHRVDSLTSLVALLTVTGGVLFDVVWLDSIGGLCVSILIIRAGWATFKTSWNELVDRGEKIGSELYDKIQSVITEELQKDSRFSLKDLSVLSSGANTNLYFTLVTNETVELSELNKVEELVKSIIKQDDPFVRHIYVKFESEKANK